VFIDQKRQYKTYTKALKEDVVALIIGQSYTVNEVLS